jgi:hypothetical protein
MEFGEYFEKIMDMVGDIGRILNHLPRYAHLYPENKNLGEAMITIYRAIFDFCFEAKHVFRVGKQKSCGMKSIRDVVSLTSVIRLLWKPFSVQFGGIKGRIEKAVAMIDAEADLAERELAKQERQKDEDRWNKAEASQQRLGSFLDLENMEKLDAWLSSANVRTNHMTASGLRYADTGSWFLAGEAFKTWIDAPNSFLWLSAIRMYDHFAKFNQGLTNLSQLAQVRRSWPRASLTMSKKTSRVHVPASPTSTAITRMSRNKSPR